MNKIKKFFIGVKEKLIEAHNETPNSSKFWNAVVLVVLVESGFFDLGLLGLLLIVGSLITLFLLISEIDIRDHYWILLMPVIWVISIIAALSAFSLKWIRRFNSWMDRKDENVSK